MGNRKIIAKLFILTIFMSSLMLGGQVGQKNNITFTQEKVTKKQIEESVKNEIYKVYDSVSKAFSDLNIPKILSYFSDSEDMVKISSGVVLTGKKELSDYFNKITKQLKKLDIKIENIKIHQIDEYHVWTVADEYINYDGIITKAIVSNILIKTDKGWKILHDHTSLVNEKK